MPPTPFKTIAEAKTAYPTAAEFRIALVDYVHFAQNRLKDIPPLQLLEACGVDVGNIDEFCLSQVPNDRRVMLAGKETGWRFRYTYKITGKNRRSVRFQTEHGCGGKCEEVIGPYIYTRS